MDIRQLELSTSSEDDADEFPDPLRSTDGSGKNHSRRGKELPQATGLILRRDLGFQVPVHSTSLAQSTIAGVTYSKVSKHAGNANILVKEEGSALPRPVKIMEILRVQEEIVMLIQYHQRPTHQAHDPFHAYPIFRTSVWGVDLTQLHAIRPSQIDSHFAELRTTWGNVEEVFAISLSRVSISCCRSSNGLTDQRDLSIS